MSDGELVRQALSGRACACEELARRWSASVTAMCHAKTGSREAAEDLAQETLLRGFRALSRLDDPEKFGAWLRGIAHRVCLDWFKAKRRAPANFTALGPDFEPTVEAAAGCETAEQQCERAEETDRLLRAVEGLPENYREVLMLYYYTDGAYRDLAEVLGVSSATINARLTKARALLRRRLAPTGG